MSRIDTIRAAIRAGAVRKAELARHLGMHRQHLDRWLAHAADKDAAIQRAVEYCASGDRRKPTI
jgi:hypothetical protein